MLFNLVSVYAPFSFFLYFLIPLVIAQIFNPMAELVIPKGIPSKEVKTDIEIDQVTAEVKLRKCLI